MQEGQDVTRETCLHGFDGVVLSLGVGRHKNLKMIVIAGSVEHTTTRSTCHLEMRGQIDADELRKREIEEGKEREVRMR